MFIELLRADYHKEAVTHIRESRRFELMYTLQVKSDQHVTRIPRSVRVWSQTICISHGPRIATFCVVINRFEQIHYPKKNGSRPNPQHDGWSVCGSVPRFSTITANEAVEKRQTFVDSRLLALSGSYLWHAIGMFNNCSRGSTHRSLIDTGGATTLEVPVFHISLSDLPNRRSQLFT
jgi:hypothetical protein